jgi:hypothetical protein
LRKTPENTKSKVVWVVHASPEHVTVVGRV